MNQATPFRVVVFGGRKYDKTEPLFSHLDRIAARAGRVLIIHGAASGADMLGMDWAVLRGQLHDPYPAAWDDLTAPGAVIARGYNQKQYNKMAGFDRNQRMIDEGKPEFAVECPGGPGTLDMHNRVSRRGIPLYVITEQAA